MSKYLFSIIIPHHNVHKLLRKLLNSIPRRDDLQVIVIDDCSNKGLEELEMIKNDYQWVEWYTTGTNGGGGKARNIGLKYAKGKYLIFSDSDDYFTQEFSDFLDKYKSMNFDVLYFCPLVVEEVSEGIIEKKNNWIAQGIKEYKKTKDVQHLKFHFTQPWCKIIKRKLVEKNHISFEESIVSNDVKFSTLVDYYSNDIIASDEAVYVWTVRRTSTSHRLTEAKILKRLQIDIERHNFLKTINVKDRNEYLAMLDQVYENGSKSLKSNAYELMRSLNVSKVAISNFFFKKFLRMIVGKLWI